jgi:hypothetical protein
MLIFHGSYPISILPFPELDRHFVELDSVVNSIMVAIVVTVRDLLHRSVPPSPKKILSHVHLHFHLVGACPLVSFPVFYPSCLPQSLTSSFRVQLHASVSYSETIVQYMMSYRRNSVI